jgi:hypothetical protein
MSRVHLRNGLIVGYALIGLAAAAAHAYLLAGVFLGAAPLVVIYPMLASWRSHPSSSVIAMWLLASASLAFAALISITAVAGPDAIARAPGWFSMALCVVFGVAFVVGSAFQRRGVPPPKIQPPPRRGTAA